MPSKVNGLGGIDGGPGFLVLPAAVKLELCIGGSPFRGDRQKKCLGLRWNRGGGAERNEGDERNAEKKPLHVSAGTEAFDPSGDKRGKIKSEVPSETCQNAR